MSQHVSEIIEAVLASRAKYTCTPYLLPQAGGWRQLTGVYSLEQTEEDKACSFVQIRDSMKPDTTDQNHKIENKKLLVVDC